MDNQNQWGKIEMNCKADNSAKSLAMQIVTPEMVETICKARELARIYNETDPRDEKRKREILGQLLGSVGEAQRAQNAQRVLRKTLFGISHAPYDSIL